MVSVQSSLMVTEVDPAELAAEEALLAVESEAFGLLAFASDMPCCGLP